MSGPLSGVRIVEFAGIGPAPFAGMMLADHGAEVIRIDRPGGTLGGVEIDRTTDVLARSRKSIVIDLKSPDGLEVVRELCRSADGVMEGFRPGVMERLGISPERLLTDNPRLVYGRMTGWGQDGPYAAAAGHDLNYIALAGALHYFGRAGAKPAPPINLVGDFGGGGMVLAFGMLAGILSARATGRGQVVDCSMTEGAGLLMSMVWGLKAQTAWSDTRGTNLLDTGAPFYDVYETRDGGMVSLAAIEPQFYREFRQRVGLIGDPDFDDQLTPAAWPRQRAKLEALFKTRTRDQWCETLEGTDACFAPVLTMDEARNHPHNQARSAFVDVAGVAQPAPAPRFGATPADPPRAPVLAGADTEQILRDLNYGPDRIAALISTGAVRDAAR